MCLLKFPFRNDLNIIIHVGNWHDMYNEIKIDLNTVTYEKNVKFGCIMVDIERHNVCMHGDDLTPKRS